MSLRFLRCPRHIPDPIGCCEDKRSGNDFFSRHGRWLYQRKCRYNGAKSKKIRVIPHAFQDHARFEASDLDFDDQHPVLMTEKDAVKCRAFADPRFWGVAVNLEFEDGGGDRLLRRVLRDL